MEELGTWGTEVEILALSGRYRPVVCVKTTDRIRCCSFCKHTNLPCGAKACAFCEPSVPSQLSADGRDYQPDVECYDSDIGYYEPDTERYEFEARYRALDSGERGCPTGERRRGRERERDNAEQDAESYSPSTPWVDVDPSDREARSGRRGELRESSTNRTPSLTALGEEDTDIEIHWVHIVHSWKKFLEWLGDRWCCDAPFDKITRALNQPTAQKAMIISEPREPSRLSALCSIAWKGEKDKLRSHAIVLNRGMYTCTDLRGYFDSPTNIAVNMSRLRGLEILSKPRHLMSHKKSYFYDSRIPTQLRNIKDALKGAWWGIYSRRQSLATMESVLRNLTPFHTHVGPYGVQLFDLSCGGETRAGIVTASTDATETRGPGYLFEVLTSPDTLGDVVKYKVVFSAQRFMVLIEDGKEQLTTPHADIRGVIHHLTKGQKIVLLSRE
ncbi:hypothetical protein Q5P01_005410 [Channa striata]|uniref:Uncharacterized protein n=1 Tax=Channa striata TaxID=64152 RepID=A0AA88T199_CHASR|nr:hypothetical protein Q5P01_005410 [Channa striata]